jgi:hypothetical protein
MADDKQNKLTVYQGLNKLLNLDGFGFQEQTPMSSTASLGAPVLQSLRATLLKKYIKRV